MIRALVFAGIAAVAGRQLYKSGALDRFGDSLKARADSLKSFAEDKRLEIAKASDAKAHGDAMPAVARRTAPHLSA